MTATRLPPRASLLGNRRRLADRAFHLGSWLSGAAVFVVLALIAFTMTNRAWPALSAEGVSFVTSSRWAPSQDIYGALAFISGTMLISLIALALAVPVSIGIALFVSVIAPRWLRQPVVYLIDLLAAIPSVVFGLWGLLVVAPVIVSFYDDVSRVLAPVPLVGGIFSGPVNGKSLFTAGMILALMITPIVTSISREVFDTVPRSLKEAAWALGSTRWEMIRGAVFPHSRDGVIGGVMLGLGRAMGETIAAALVIGSSPQLTARIFGSGDAMAAVIANQFGEAGGLHRSALIGLGVLLFLMTIVVNLIARVIVARQEARLAGLR